jgi:hypothetical protein
MKKLLFIIGLFATIGISAQDIARDSLSAKTTTATTDYGLIISGASGSEQMFRMDAQYFLPMTWAGGYVRPRAITDKLMIGTASNFNYGLYNAGTSYFNNNVYLATGTRLYFGSCRISDVMGSLAFYDPTVGTKTLTDLIAGGSGTIDTTGLPIAGRVAVFTSATTIGNPTNENDIFLLNDNGYGYAVSGANDDLNITSNGVVYMSGTSASFTFTSASDFNGDLTIDGSLNLSDALGLHYMNLASTDTVALICKGAGEWVDSASLVSAAAGWQAKLGNYYSFYKDSKDHNALPLPYPNGTERREMNAIYSNYQTEFELERIHRYMFRMWIENKAQWLLILLLAFGLYKVKK